MSRHGELDQDRSRGGAVDEVTLLRGQLLIASSLLQDPNFRRTVVLVTEHGEAGAMGLVLNRPSPIAVGEALPDLADVLDPNALVYVGGPVQPAAVTVLAEFADVDEAAALVFDEVGFVAGEPDLDSLAGATRRARAFAGCAGWAPGQLEAELDQLAWILEPALADDVFVADPNALWSAVLRRKGGEFALLATMPPDPSLN